MLTTDINRGASGDHPRDRGSRRRNGAKSRRSQATSATTKAKAPDDDTLAAEAQFGDTIEAHEGAVGATRGLRIHSGRNAEAPEVMDSPDDGATTRDSRRGLDAAARSDGDPDDQLQLTLKLNEPEPRGYEPSAKPPQKRVDTTRWLWLAMGMGAATCPILLVFQLVFTNPAHGANVLAVVATIAFGALFSTWTFEYWLRRGPAGTSARPAPWALTRHAILAALGVAAMAVSALNGTASFGLLLLVAFTLIVADIVLRRVRIR